MLKSLVLLLALSALVACGATTSPDSNPREAMSDPDSPAPPSSDSDAAATSVATFGSGCFWCAEAVLEQLDGVQSVDSGYMGGTTENPTYLEVCNGRSGHAEVVQVHFDPDVISYEALLAWFWRLHDPTTLNRQGNDVGTQYRSVIFFHDAEQEQAARKSLRAEDAGGSHLGPIVTEIVAASTFYEAEESHQDYYRGNKSQGYCRMVIAPKLEKLGLDH